MFDYSDRNDEVDYGDPSWPPYKHPGRELFTFSLFLVIVISGLIWGAIKLWSDLESWLG
jgi:hypothetical protein